MLRSILLVALLIVVPGLCMAGVLLHPCDCDSGTSCTHEVACRSDPCGEAAIRPAPVAQATPTDLALPLTDPVSAFAGPLPTWNPPADHMSRSVFGRPLHESDVPLRI